MKFNRYKRGSLIMVDFSPQVGSEIKGKHLAIVITKNDSPSNAVLTVIPLSSKSKPYYLNLGSFLGTVVFPKIDEALEILDNEIKTITNSSELIEIQKNTLMLRKVVDTYIKMNVNSYALVQNISTISKLRVLKPINKFDPMGKITVPDYLLDKIDATIAELFIGK